MRGLMGSNWEELWGVLLFFWKGDIMNIVRENVRRRLSNRRGVTQEMVFCVYTDSIQLCKVTVCGGNILSMW